MNTFLKKMTLLTPVIIGVCVFAPYLSASTNAVTKADWNPARIIDDAVFFNPESMSAQQIQDFLNAKLPTCDTNGQQSHTYRYNSSTGRVNFSGNQYEPADPWTTTSRATYGQRYDSWHGVDNARPPYTCLKSFSQNIPGVSPDSFCTGSVGAGTKSAATIIKEVATACNISPQVILITLQKEQSLITDDWPWKIQYTKATGMGCPDTSLGVDVDANQNGCYDEYEGFFKQVYYGARQFQRYVKQPHLFNYAMGRNSYVAYQDPRVDSNCGGTYITPQSHATAALYNYTPYQPNDAALTDMYGNGDIANPAPPNCSAFGNRNFWRMFNDWFGSPYAPSFRAKFRAQSTYPTIRAGESVVIYMQFINKGTGFWKDDATTFPGYHPVHLAATNPINRTSSFRSPNWLNASRPNGTFSKVLEADGWNLASDQHTVHPGQIAEFRFTLTIPYEQSGGTYREYFQPVLEGADSWDMGTWTYLDINVVQNNDRAQFHSQSPYPSIVNGATKNVYYQIKNVGNTTWYDKISVPAGKYPFVLATTWPINRASIFSKNWPSKSRISHVFTKVYEQDGVTLSNNQHIVLPGQIARYEFDLYSPMNQKPGTYREYFQPILEGAKKWDAGGIGYFDISVESQKFKASYKSQSPYPTILRGQTTQVYFEYRNSGNTFWKDSISAFPGFPSTKLATTWPINRKSVFASSSWPTYSRPAAVFSRVFEADGLTLTSDQHTVLPGQVVRYELELKAPTNISPGNYREYFQPILEGANSWDMGGVVYIDILVK